MSPRGSTRLFALGVLFVVVGLALSGLAVAESVSRARPQWILAPVALGLAAFVGGVLAGRR
ncbi:MAG: hypothetical protein ABEI99_11970 [Halobaculum sp.]